MSEKGTRPAMVAASLAGEVLIRDSADEAWHDGGEDGKLKALLDWMRRGFPLIPISPDAKAPPLITDPLRRATLSESKVKRWLRRWPNANFAWQPSRFIVVDVDMREGKDGEQVLRNLALFGEILPATLTVRSANGGRHLIYALPPNVAVASGADVLGLGVDVKSAGGYVMAPGSVVDGKDYVIQNDVSVAPAPPWLIEKCNKPRAKSRQASKVPPAPIDRNAAERRAVDYLQRNAPIAIEGAGGDGTTYRVACRVKDLGVSQPAALELMLAHWNDRCAPPWNDDELAAKVRNAYAYGSAGVGAAAPEVAFAEVDVFADVHQWSRAELVANADAMLALDDARLADVRDTVVMFGIADDVDQILEDTRLRADSGVDVLAILAEPARAHSDAVVTQLAALKKTAPEALERVRERLTAGRKPAVGKRDFNGLIKRGEALAIREEAERDALARDKRVLMYDAGQLPECCDEIEAALVADFGQDRERVLAYGGAYATVRERAPTVVAQLNGDVYPAQPLIQRYDAPALRERIMRSVILIPKGDGAPMRCPDDVVQTLLSRRGGNAPPLAGIVEAPTLRPDGSLLDAPGYDSGTGLYAWFDPAAFPGIPAAPTLEEAAAALMFLRDEFLDEFEFASPVDKDVAIAALLTALLRRTLPDVPGFLFSAPQQSSGKTALANAISGAAFGRPAAAVGWPRSDEEMGKMLIGLLQQGQTAICFDNARDGSALASTELARAMTSPTFGGRLLGVNDHAEFPTSVVWFITGNNVATAQDMTTRFVSCVLQPTAARPDQRTFRRNLASWVTLNRARVVAAGLTILRAYRAAGAPVVGGKPSRFRTWDANVRFALVYAGGRDVGVKFDEADLADSALGTLRRLLRLWPSVMGTQGVQAKAIQTKYAYASGDVESEFAEALRDLLAESSGKAEPTARGIGACLRRWKDRVAGGYRLTMVVDKHNEVTLWRSVPVATGE